MANTAADVLIDTLHEWGVEVIFGLPGDGINGLMEALRKRQDRIRFVQVRHEEMKHKGSKRNVPGHTSDVFARSARLPIEERSRARGGDSVRGSEGRDSRRTSDPAQFACRAEDRSFLERAQSSMHEWWELVEERGTRPERR